MKNRGFNVLHVLGSLDARAGGMAGSVKNLAEHMTSLTVKADVWTFGCPYQDSKINLKNGVQHFIAPSFIFSKNLAGWNPWAAYHLGIVATNYDVFHSHGNWLFGNTYAKSIAQKMNKPFIVSPRGMLETWALKSKKIKKAIAWHLYEKRNLQAVSLFHATSDMEAESIRRLGFRQPIAVIPNGVDLGLARPVLTQTPKKENKKTLLFLSRIDPKKGLERLFSIWGRLSKQFLNWELVIGGSGASSYIRQLKSNLRELGADTRVRWVGFVEGDEKAALYAGATLFVLPTFSENFGNVVGEALSFGIPVVTTTGTPWSQIQSERCGWYAENNELAIESALIKAMESSDLVLKEMGGRGRYLIEKKYSWVKVAAQMVESYEWLLNLNDKPAWILNS